MKPQTVKILRRLELKATPRSRGEFVARWHLKQLLDERAALLQGLRKAMKAGCIALDVRSCTGCGPLRRAMLRAER